MATAGVKWLNFLFRRIVFPPNSVTLDEEWSKIHYRGTCDPDNGKPT